MRVAMYYNNRDVRTQEMPLPPIGSGELLVKMRAAGICGSDVLEWYRIKKAPLVLGHEITGEIDGLGAGVAGYKPGDRVFVSHHVPCNSCRYCLHGHHTVCETLQTTNYYPGGFAEYIRVPQINVDRGVFVLPGDISFEDGTLIEPLACVIRAQRMAHLQPDQTLHIFGAGVSGLLHLVAARARGAGRVVVTDINSYRLSKALELGAHAVINAHEDVSASLRKINDGRLADVVVVCTGAKAAFLQALKCVERSGTVVCFAAPEPGVDIPLPVNEFWRQSIRIIHSYGSAPLDTHMAIAMLRSGKIPAQKLITHRFSLEQTSDAFKLVAEAGECMKVIIVQG